MPRPNQYLLLYVLDLLSVFARKSDKNLMTATSMCLSRVHFLVPPKVHRADADPFTSAFSQTLR